MDPAIPAKSCPIIGLLVKELPHIDDGEKL
jgi:hypothetical protein